MSDPKSVLSFDQRQHRTDAAKTFQPHHINLLLVAEAPPSASDRYFYFESVTEHDSLFRYVARGILGGEPTRANKRQLLDDLKAMGVFLIDVVTDPLTKNDLAPFIPDLIDRCKALRPKKIVLIKSTVYDAAYSALRAAGLPVVDQRIPFPGSGQQKKFQECFARALSTSST